MSFIARSLKRGYFFLVPLSGKLLRGRKVMLGKEILCSKCRRRKNVSTLGGTGRRRETQWRRKETHGHIGRRNGDAG